MGLYCLHNLSPPLFHRDVKSENVFLMKRAEIGIGEIENLKNPVAKLGDFGLSVLSDCDLKVFENINPRYAAPEILSNLSYNGKVDIYSFGIMLWELVYRKIAFKDFDEGPFEMEQIQQAVTSGVRPPLKRRDPLDRLINRCVHQDPNQRPTALEVCESIRSLVSMRTPKLFPFLPPLPSLNRDDMQSFTEKSTTFDLCNMFKLPDPTEDQKSHRIILSKLADRILWLGCYNGSLIAFNVDKFPFRPCFASSLSLREEKLSSGISALEVCPSLMQVWTARENGIIQVVPQFSIHCSHLN